jgi:hypothetical protein
MEKPMKTRKFYRDGLEETIVGQIRVRVTSEGHVVEIYKTSDGTKKFFATIAGSHFCAHGFSLADAIGSALWKDPERRPSMQSLVESVKDNKKHKFTLNEFRLITGACLTGCRAALAQAGRDESPMTAFDIRDIVSREWGNKLISVLGWEGEKS